MTASLYSSKTVGTDYGKDHDPEALVKGSLDAPVVLVTVEAADSPGENDRNASEKGSSPWEVSLEESEDPKTMAAWYKWVAVLMTSSGAICVSSASSMVSPAPHILSQSDLTCSFPVGHFR